MQKNQSALRKSGNIWIYTIIDAFFRSGFTRLVTQRFLSRKKTDISDRLKSFLSLFA